MDKKFEELNSKWVEKLDKVTKDYEKKVFYLFWYSIDLTNCITFLSELLDKSIRKVNTKCSLSESGCSNENDRATYTEN